MRSAAFQDYLHILRKHQIDPSQGIAVDVGGTEMVYLDGVPAPNPLRKIHPNLVFLDKGFNIELLQTAADQVIDFLNREAILPLAERFDFVLCFDTLEHVPNPFMFCENLIFVTRNGGYIYVATVFEWPYHPSPEDYFRFSPSGLKECFINPLNALGTELTILDCNWGSDGKGVFLFGQRRRTDRKLA